jgi:molybdate transport system substrate-binding protein
MRTRILILLFVAWVFVIPLSASAEDQKITVGVAANFIVPFGEIASLFEKQTGVKVEPVFTSSGKLYAQINSGAPYDLFLSADEERPAKLYKDGLAAKPIVYATGRIVLWSADKQFCSSVKDWVEAVQSPKVKKISLANPETAPYGAAAMAALKKAGITDAIKDKLVFPQDIGQSFQYASTGSVDVGFCALSSAMTDEGKKGCYLSMDQAQSVVQAACVLVKGPNRKDAERFAAFLLTPEAISVKERYGYK